MAKRTADQNENGNLRAAFNEFDIDDDGASTKHSHMPILCLLGYIGTRELRSVLSKLGHNRMSDLEVTF